MYVMHIWRQRTGQQNVWWDQTGNSFLIFCQALDDLLLFFSNWVADEFLLIIKLLCTRKKWLISIFFDKLKYTSRSIGSIPKNFVMFGQRIHFYQYSKNKTFSSDMITFFETNFWSICQLNVEGYIPSLGEQQILEKTFWLFYVRYTFLLAGWS